MFRDPYFEQKKQHIRSLISEKKFTEAYDLCNEVIGESPEEEDFSELKNEIEEKVEKENTGTIKERLKSLKPLWKEKNYAEILKELKDLLEISENNKKVIDEYQKAQKLYRKKLEKDQKHFAKEQKQRLTELLEDNPNLLSEELSDLERTNPNNKTIQELSKEFKDKLIQKKIEDKQKLLKSNKYDAIANFLTILKKIDKDSKSLHELEATLKNNLKGKQKEAKSEFLYKSINYLSTLMKLKKYNKATKVAKEILEAEGENEKAKKILKKAKKKYFKQSREKSIDSIQENLQTLKAKYKENKKDFIKI